MWIAARKMRLKLLDGLVGGVDSDGSLLFGSLGPGRGRSGD